MPYRKFPLVAGETYHIYNRGNHRQEIFFERENYLLFLRLIRKYLVEDRTVALLACCLMPNHYHLMVRQVSADLSRRMQAMLLAFTKSMNRRYARVGGLFQGRFEAALVSMEAHGQYLTAYIHLNPVRAGIVKRAEDWEFSSYREYVGLRRGSLVAPAELWSGSRADYRRFVESFGPRQQAELDAVRLDA